MECIHDLLVFTEDSSDWGKNQEVNTGAEVLCCLTLEHIETPCSDATMAFELKTEPQ